MKNINYLSPESLSDTINVTQSHTRHIRQQASKRGSERIVYLSQGECKVENWRGGEILRHSLKGFGINLWGV